MARSELHAESQAPAHRVAMLLENNPYPQDVRVRSEARSLAAAGHTVTVIAPRGTRQPRRERIDGVNVIRFRSLDGSETGGAAFLLEYLVACTQLQLLAFRELLRGATVVHLHNPPDILFPVAALYRLAGRKVVFDHHDLFPETVELRFGAGLLSRLARSCQALTIDVAHHVIATNTSYAEVSLRRKRPDAVTVVRNAPPATWTEVPVAHRDGVLEPVRLVYVGAMAPQDGVSGLATLMGKLCRGGDPIDAHLTIVGNGSERARVEREMRALGVGDRVTFTGWVNPEQVLELLQDADVCVDPSPATDVNERSTMTKIAEYLALGKPVVAYDLLETRRTAGDAALLVERDNAEEFASAIRTLATSPGLRRRLSHDARARAREMLTWDRSASALLAVYAGLGQSRQSWSGFRSRSNSRRTVSTE
jgi:glycosyltransferase involved in cell wall biosynthesis